MANANSFRFFFLAQVSHKELQDQTVKFTVIDNGRLRKRQVIGHLLCSLKNISIEDGKQVGTTKEYYNVLSAYNVLWASPFRTSLLLL